MSSTRGSDRDLMDDPVLRVRNLSVDYPVHRGTIRAVDDASFDVARGQRIGIVGESGSGKSTLGLAIMGLIRSPGRVSGGTIELQGRDLVGLDERALSAIRGKSVAMIYQDPFTYLNPVHRVGDQVAEVLERHTDLPADGIRAEVVGLFARLRLEPPATIYQAFPHQLSGGQRQRVVIAMAIALRPAIIIADEPTTALDVTVQAQILRLLRATTEGIGAALILISHDLQVVRSVCDRIT